MHSPNPPDGKLSPDAGPQVAATVRLLHRRRGWALTALGSFVGFVAYAIIGSQLFPNASGALAAISGLVVILLMGLTLTGLIVAAVDTAHLRRRDPATRAHAAGRAAHYPLRAHAYRYPPRHRTSWLFSWVVLAVWLVLMVTLLPNQVNAVAYLAGAGHEVTFFPTSYGQNCGRGGCSTVTNGLLATGGSGIRATWPGQAPLGSPFTVREPVWTGWGSPAQLVDGTTGAVVSVIVGLIFDLVTVLIIFALVKLVRQLLQRRRQAAGSVTAMPSGAA